MAIPGAEIFMEKGRRRGIFASPFSFGAFSMKSLGSTGVDKKPWQNKLEWVLGGREEKGTS